MSSIGKIINYSKKLGGFLGFIKVYVLFREYKSNKSGKENQLVSLYLKNLKKDSLVAILWSLYLAEEYKYDWNKDYAPQIIVDAGANIGLFSLIFADLFSGAQIYAIEPDDDNYSLLKMNTEENANIIAIKGGLWNKDVMLSVSSNLSAMGITVSESKTGNIKGISVGQLMKENNIEKIDIFKIDIEGSGKELFESNYESWIGDPDCYIIEPHEYIKSGIDTLLLSRLVQENNYKTFIRGENTIYYKGSVVYQPEK